MNEADADRLDSEIVCARAGAGARTGGRGSKREPARATERRRGRAAGEPSEEIGERVEKSASPPPPPFRLPISFFLPHRYSTLL